MTQWSTIQAITANGKSAPADAPERAIVTDLHRRIIQNLDDSAVQTLGADRRREHVERATRALLAEIYPNVVGDDKEDIIGYVVNEVAGLGPIEPLLRDPTVSEVMVNGPDAIYYERNGVIYKSDVTFMDNAHLLRIIERIVSPIGRHVDEATPMVDARLPDGSRVNIVIPPLVPNSPAITIRKFRRDRHSMKDLVAIGSLTENMARFLDACVKAKLNIIVSGGTGAGKTTFLNALSAAMGARERIVTIEDPLELVLQQEHVVRMEARPSSTEGTGEVTQRDLVRNALRMRPDRIIVGEVRGSEAFDMMQAMNTGHEGSISTVHANSPRDALSRIQNMVLMAGFDIPARSIREQMASALDLIIQISRLTDGSRKVVQVTEVSGMEGDVITLQDLFVFKQMGVDKDGKVRGDLLPTGIRPHAATKITAAGIELPWHMFNRIG